MKKDKMQMIQKIYTLSYMTFLRIHINQRYMIKNEIKIQIIFYFIINKKMNYNNCKKFIK